MAQVIAVFGAGPGLGASVARRFGLAGHLVALVGRRPEALQTLVTELAAEGIVAGAFPADLGDQGAALAALAEIRERYGRIDVVYYGPAGGGMARIPARDMRADWLRPLIDVLLLTPVELVHAVLPEMLDRGAGAILIAHGASAVYPEPELSGVGPIMAATRNWVYSLHAEVADQGVYVGTIAVSAMIARSAAYQALTSGALDFPGASEIPVVDPDDLAGLLWDLTSTRDRVELVHP